MSKTAGRSGRAGAAEGELRVIRRRIAASVAVFLGLAAAGLFATGAAAAPKPSFVVIQTDDQPRNAFDRRFRNLYDNWRQIMPKTMKLMRN